MSIKTWPTRFDDAIGLQFLSSSAPQLNADEWLSAPVAFLSLTLTALRTRDPECEAIVQRCVEPWIGATQSRPLDDHRRLWLRRFADALLAENRFKRHLLDMMLPRAHKEHNECLQNGVYDSDFILSATQGKLPRSPSTVEPVSILRFYVSMMRIGHWFVSKASRAVAEHLSSEIGLYGLNGQIEDACELIALAEVHFDWLNGEPLPSCSNGFAFALADGMQYLGSCNWHEGVIAVHRCITSKCKPRNAAWQLATYRMAESLLSRSEYHSAVEHLELLLDLGSDVTDEALRKTAIAQYHEASIQSGVDPKRIRDACLRFSAGLPDVFISELRTMLETTIAASDGLTIHGELAASFHDVLTAVQTSAPLEDRFRMQLLRNGFHFDQAQDAIHGLLLEIAYTSKLSQNGTQRDKRRYKQQVSIIRSVLSSALEHVHDALSQSSLNDIDADDIDDDSSCEDAIDDAKWFLMQLITSESIENLLNHDDVDTNRLKREKFNSDVCRGLRMLIDGIQRATPAGVLDVVAVSDTAQSVLRIATHLVCILLTEEVSSREFGTFLPSSHPRFALVKMCACAIEVVSQWRSLAGFTFYKDLRSSDDVRLINDSFSLALDGRNQPLFRQKLEKRSGETSDLLQKTKQELALRARTAKRDSIQLTGLTPDLIENALEGHSKVAVTLLVSSESDHDQVFVIQCSSHGLVFLSTQCFAPLFAIQRRNERSTEVVKLEKIAALTQSAIAELKDAIQSEYRMALSKTTVVRDLAECSCSWSAVSGMRSIQLLGRNVLPGRLQVRSGVPVFSLWSPYSDSAEGASDLPWVEKEVGELSSMDIMGYCVVETNVGKDCRRSKFLQHDWRSIDILHIACHGHFFQSIPEAAHLEFSTEKHPDEPASLHIFDLATCDFAGIRLVFLNCCDSRHAVRVSGHDRLSIAQSFLSAGAQYVIATRYPVPDELAFRFAKEFYECLWSGSAPDELMIPGAFFEAIRRLESESEATGLSVKLLYELIM